jgi:hypothetical protein
MNNDPKEPINRKAAWPDGLAPLATIFLGTFIAITWYAIFIKQRVLCGLHEDEVVGGRDWISAIGTPIGIVVSAWFIVRQIRVGRAQLIPPMIEYLERANDHLDALRDAFAGAEVILDWLKELAERKDRIEIEETISTLQAIANKKPDAQKMKYDIIRSRLTEDLHDKCMIAASQWTEVDFRLSTAAEMGRRSLQSDTLNHDASQKLQARVHELLEEIKIAEPEYVQSIDAVRTELRSVFETNEGRIRRERDKALEELDS